MKEPRRGYCPKCGIPIVVNNDGTLRKHGNLLRGRTWNKTECEGSGQVATSFVGEGARQ